MKSLKSLILGLILVALTFNVASAATGFSEFYVQTTGFNGNAGSTTNDAAVYSSTNGNWDGTSLYIPTDGTTPASTVTAGDWASVYLDGATVAVYVARVTAVAAGANGTITLSTTAFGGAIPASGATGRTIKVGGAWKGPNGAVGFPFGFVANTMTNLNSGSAQGFVPRVNFKGGTTYNITAVMTQASNGPVRWQGYTTSPGDLGKATIDGGTSGASFSLLLVSGNNHDFADFIFSNNGASTASVGVSSTGAENAFTRIVFHNLRGSGFSSAGICLLNECEAYLCNQNAATGAGFTLSGVSTVIRCNSHDNAGANTAGFSSSVSVTYINCIADSNGGAGILYTAVTTLYVYGCDLYNNTGSGIDMSGATATLATIQNCNFIKNGVWGINSSGSAIRNGQIVNCGFGAGTQVNASGAIAAVGGINETGTITYATDVTPWVDPANGDFRINLAAAKGAGRGTFTETQASYSGTIGYPDIGAAQHLDSGGGATEHSYPFVK